MNRVTFFIDEVETIESFDYLFSELEDGRYIIHSNPITFEYIVEKHSDGVPKDVMIGYLKIIFGLAHEELKIIAFTKDGPIFARKS